MNRRRKLKKKKPFLKYKFFVWCFVFLASAGTVGYVLFFSPLFQVQAIRLEGSTNKNILAKAEVLLEYPVLFLSTKSMFFVPRNNAVQQMMLREFPELRQANVWYDFPSTLVLRVTERTEVAQWCKEDLCFALDSQGTAFKKSAAKGFLKIVSENPVDPSLLSTLLLFQKTTGHVEVAKIISKERVDFSTPEGWKIFFNPQKPLEWQATKLNTVLEKKIPSERRSLLEYVDVRFGNQVYLKYR